MKGIRGPAFVGMVVGGFFLLIGGWALARAGIAPLVRQGIGADTLFEPQVVVLGFRHTRLLALIEILFGFFVFLSGVGSAPGTGRGTLRILGAAGAVFGLVLTVAAPVFARPLAAQPRNGLLFLVAGVLCVAVSLPAPGGRRLRG